MSLRISHAAGTAVLAAASLLAAAPPASSQSAAGQRVERHKVVVVEPETGEPRIVHTFARRGLLGVQLLDLTPELRRFFGGSEERGVLVSRVVENGPAAACGIQVGDLIVAIDGRPVSGSRQVGEQIGSRRQGDQAVIDLLRERRPRTLTASLAESDRPQIEVGELLWQGGGGERVVVKVDSSELGELVTIDRSAVAESMQRLIERIESGELPPPAVLHERERLTFERRIEELERRLRELERRLRQLAPDGP